MMNSLRLSNRRLRAGDTGLKARVGGIATPLVAFLLLLAVWEAACDVFNVPRYILPTPTAIFGQFASYGFAIWPATLVTLSETLLGFAAAIVVAVPLSMIVAFSPFLRRTFYPGAVALEMVPKIAFAPLFVTWFGFGYAPKILIVVLVCFFPILLNGLLAFNSLSTEVQYLARSTGATSWRTFWKVRLPAALPQLFVGIKGAAVNATVGAVISEWIGGNAGLGYLLQVNTGYLRLDRAFACILVLTAIGLGVFLVVLLAERALIPWHVSQRPRRPTPGK
jgi:NitT/TauT family transport system permease protein